MLKTDAASDRNYINVSSIFIMYFHLFVTLCLTIFVNEFGYCVLFSNLFYFFCFFGRYVTFFFLKSSKWIL